MESSPFRCYTTSLKDDVFPNDTGVRITVVNTPTPVCKDAFVHKKYMQISNREVCRQGIPQPCQC
ncbi:hypothetical protein CUAC110533_08295 [Cutibacterium acnes subsp. elongatum]